MTPPDPVSQWLTQAGLSCHLTHTIGFKLDHGSLVIRSNAAELIQRAMACFCYYPVIDNPELLAAADTQIEVYCIGDKADSQGVYPDDAWLSQFPAATETKLSSQPPIVDFLYASDGKTQCFWRPVDTMVTMACNGQGPIRILAADNLSMDSKQAIVPKLARKGRRRFPVNADELMDLIKILYIQSRQLFCIHGASLAIQGRGILLTGHSGAGKTTTALAMARDGFILLSDELTVVDANASTGLEMAGLLIPPAIVGPTPVSIATIESSLTNSDREGKSDLRLPDLMVQQGRNTRVRPKVLFFIERAIDPHGAPHCMPISSQEAFVMLAEQALDLTSAFRHRQRMEALLDFAHGCDCYRLMLTHDLKAIPALVRSVIQPTPQNEKIEIAEAFMDDQRPPVRVAGVKIALEQEDELSGQLLVNAMDDPDDTVWQAAEQALLHRYPWLALKPHFVREMPNKAIQTPRGQAWASFRAYLQTWLAGRSSDHEPIAVHRWARMPGAVPDLVEALIQGNREEDAAAFENDLDIFLERPKNSRQILLAPTYACNLNCSYCYAKGWDALYEGEMRADRLTQLIAWCARQDINCINLCGGEPTVYKQLSQLLTQARDHHIKISMASNMLYADAVRAYISPQWIDELIAHFDQGLLDSPQKAKRFHNNIAAAKTMRERLFIRYTLTQQSTPGEWRQVIDLACNNGVDSINYAFSFANFTQNNDAFAIIDAGKTDFFETMFAQFSSDCTAAGLGMHLCKPLPLCAFSDEHLKTYLRSGVLRSACAAYLRGCTQNITVNPDLSIYPCNSVAMKGPRITDFNGLADISDYYSPWVKNMLFQPYLDACHTCMFYYRGFCQGACLAEKHGQLTGSEPGDVFTGLPA